MKDNQTDLPPRSERHTSKRGNKNKERNKKSGFQELLSTVLYIAFLFVAFFVVHRYFYAPVVVDGDSMVPTLHHGDYLLLNKYSNVERFDVVVFPPPDETDETLFIKRVIGLPGDTIEYREDVLYLNGEAVDEYYLDYSSENVAYYSSGNFNLQTLLGVETVPEGQYFVLGDNRLNSRDSRSFGFIEDESIIGKVVLRYWPIEDFGVLE